MGYEEDGENPRQSAQHQKQSWGALFIHYVKRKFDERRAKREQENASERAERRTANATWFIGFFTVITACVGSLQWCSIQGQLDEMRAQREMTVIQMRAKLRPDDIKRDPVLLADGKLAGWYLTPKWTNAGSTDAINVVRWWQVGIFPNGVPAGYKCRADVPRIRPAPTIVHAGGGFSESALFLGFYEAVQALTNRPRPWIVLVSGHIEWNDEFPHTPLHQLDWCSRVVPNDIRKNIFSYIDVNMVQR